MFMPFMAQRYTTLATDSKKQHDWAETANRVLHHGGREREAIDAANASLSEDSPDATS